MCDHNDARILARLEAAMIDQIDSIMAEENIRDPSRRFALAATAAESVHIAASNSIPPTIVDLRGMIRGDH